MHKLFWGLFAFSCLVAKLCRTLCDPMDCSPLYPWDFPGRNTGVGCHFLLQGIFPSQGSNPCLLHWQAESLLLATRECHTFIYKWHYLQTLSRWLFFFFFCFISSTQMLPVIGVRSWNWFSFILVVNTGPRWSTGILGLVFLIESKSENQTNIGRRPNWTQWK